MKTLAIIGANGHGKVIADAAEQLGWKEIVFFDDRWPELSDVLGWNVLGKISSAYDAEFDGYFIAIGDNNKRKELFEHARSLGINFQNIIHPSAKISTYTSLGTGVFIAENAVVKVSTTIGDGVIVNSNSVIGHDCILSSFSHVTPNCSIAGNVYVGECSWIGNGSSIKQQIHIGDKSIVGTGSVVVKHVSSDVTVVGSPARPIVKS